MKNKFLIFAVIIAFSALVILWKRSKQKQHRVEFINSVHLKGKQTMTKTKITTEQKVKSLAKFATLAGIAAAIFGVPVWASSDEKVAIVKASADGMSADVISVGEGKATISIHAEGDLTPGFDPLDSSFEVEVVAPEAGQVILSVGTPELKTADDVQTPAAAPATAASETVAEKPPENGVAAAT